MKIEYDASFFFGNHNQIADAVNKAFEVSYAVTKDESVCSLNKDEVMFLIVKGGKFNRVDSKFITKTGEKLQKGRVVRKNVVEENMEDVDIAVTNKYIHMVHDDNHKKILVSKINKVFITVQNIVVYTDDRSYTIITRSYGLGIQIALLLDAIKKIKVDDTFVGKTINLNFKKV